MRNDAFKGRWRIGDTPRRFLLSINQGNAQQPDAFFHNRKRRWVRGGGPFQCLNIHSNPCAFVETRCKGCVVKTTDGNRRRKIERTPRRRRPQGATGGLGPSGIVFIVPTHFNANVDVRWRNPSRVSKSSLYLFNLIFYDSLQAIIINL